MPKAGKS